jgi:hypothetical protein
MPDLWVNVDAAIIVPVNVLPLLDDTDFKSIETAIAYNATGIALTWNFVTTAGAVTGTAVTPTTGGNYDWSEPVADKGMYAIEIPASGGASINNDTEGVGWFTGVATGVLPWRGPTIGFRRAALNNLLINGSTASTNLEDFFDGTGYAGGTAKLTVDAVAISGDSTAADNLEAAFDGAGYAGGTIKPKVDLETIKTQAVTCGAGVTVLASVGTAATSTAQTGDSYALVNGASGVVAIKNQTAAIETDTQDIQARVPAALTANGNIKASLVEILTTALTETAGLLAGGFKKFFNVATPTGTVNSLPDAVAGANGGLPTTNGTKLSQTVDLTAAQLAFKKNVAFPNFPFPMYDSAGALKTGLTVTAEIRKDAGSFAALAGSVTEIGATGVYTVDWAQAETNAAAIAFKATATGANPTNLTILPQV